MRETVNMLAFVLTFVTGLFLFLTGLIPFIELDPVMRLFSVVAGFSILAGSYRFNVVED